MSRDPDVPAKVIVDSGPKGSPKLSRESLGKKVALVSKVIQSTIRSLPAGPRLVCQRFRAPRRTANRSSATSVLGEVTQPARPLRRA